MRKIIIINKKHNYHEYFRGFVNSNNLKDGDEILNHEYISWIMRKHRKFRALKKIGESPYTPELKKEFILFIGGEGIEYDNKTSPG